MINIEQKIFEYVDNGTSIIEASVEISRIYSIEIETIAVVISNNSKLKALSHAEACSLRLMKDNKVAKFPKL